MKQGAGKKSRRSTRSGREHWPSQFTTELLELLWVLEATVAGYPEQTKLLEAVVSGQCFNADEMPAVRDEARKPPAHRRVLMVNYSMTCSGRRQARFQLGVL